MKDPDTGQITKNTLDEVFKKDGAKSKVVVTPIDPSVRYEKDATKAKGEAKITVAGTPGTRTVTTTYTVNPTDGNLIPHEGKPVIKPSTPTVVKVPAKDEVEYLKEGDDVVKKTTSYEVNASTGALTPTVRKDIASPNGVKSKVVTKIIPVTTRYEADKTKDVGTNTVTNNGSEGKIVTTTSTLVNETNGTVTDGTPNVSRTEMVPKVVKVGAKDKVVETPIEPEVEYVKDVEKDFGTPAQRTEGEKGKTVTTTTYDVDPKDGHITEHVGNPVVSPAGKTIVKVGAKTKVEQSKDSEGLDVIDTTTYEVDPKTGKVTPTTVRTYGTRKEPKVELEQDPKTGDVTVTPKKPDGSTYPPGTTVEIPGKDGNPITVTIGEDGKGKVPNSELPDGKVPGTAKITEPGQPAVEVPVETPAKVTPATPTDTNPVAPVTPDMPAKPDTNRGSGQDTPAPAPAIPTPNTVTPNADQVDTKTTVDNGAKSNDSQNVLPNTGTESNAALASLGLLGLLSGFGLVARKKKED